MHSNSNVVSAPSFARPKTPAAVCMHVIRLRQPVTRSVLINTSGKSQPTVTRAIAALIQAKLVRERPDLSTASGPGRPTIPIELEQSPWAHVGIAVGTKSTYVGAFNTRGQVLREQFIDVAPSGMSATEFVSIIAPAVSSLVASTKLPMVNLGITTPGTISADGMVTAESLGWDKVDIATALRNRFTCPITLSSVVRAIAGAEQQLQSPDANNTVMLFYVDDSFGAAVMNSEGVTKLNIPDMPTHSTLGQIAVSLANDTNPTTIVLAGSAFANSADARSVGLALRSSRHRDTEIRVIPTHLDNARAAARAVALDRLITDPLGLAKTHLV